MGKSKEDWQVTQAKEAIRLYLYYVSQADGSSALVPSVDRGGLEQEFHSRKPILRTLVAYGWLISVFANGSIFIDYCKDIFQPSLVQTPLFTQGVSICNTRYYPDRFPDDSGSHDKASGEEYRQATPRLPLSRRIPSGFSHNRIFTSAKKFLNLPKARGTTLYENEWKITLFTFFWGLYNRNRLKSSWNEINAYAPWKQAL